MPNFASSNHAGTEMCIRDSISFPQNLRHKKSGNQLPDSAASIDCPPANRQNKCQKFQTETFGILVGVSGLEPEASWSRTKRDTKLRHTPISEHLKRAAFQTPQYDTPFCAFCQERNGPNGNFLRGVFFIRRRFSRKLPQPLFFLRIQYRSAKAARPLKPAAIRTQPRLRANGGAKRLIRPDRAGRSVAAALLGGDAEKDFFLRVEHGRHCLLYTSRCV